MAEKQPVPKEADAEAVSQTSSNHIEDSNPVNHVLQQSEEVIFYGPSGLRGIFHSSYVLGAAALASLGGFSFGYGE